MDKFDHTKAIFVFGSNAAGLHGAGAARFALDKRGAILKVPFGLQGQSYAIPTKDASIRYTLPLERIQKYVDIFKLFAESRPDLQFQVTRIGCGLAGLRDEDIAPMFSGHPENCWFDTAWHRYLGDDMKDWGTF